MAVIEIEAPKEANSLNCPLDGNQESTASFEKTELHPHAVVKKRGGISEGASEVTLDMMFSAETNPEDFPDGGRDAYLTLFGAFMGLVIDFGIANSLGAIESYVSSHQLSNVKDTSVSWVFTIHLGVMYLGGVVFGECFDKFGARKLLIASTVFMAGGLFCTAESTKLSHFILSFGITTAIGTSLGMVPLIGVLSHWFLRKRAFACSVATIGGLVGSSVFAVMLQKLYKEVGFKWAIRVMGFMCIGCMGIAIALIKERKPKKELSDAIDDILDVQPKNKSTLVTVAHFFREALDLSIVKDARFVCLNLAVFFAEIISISSLTYLTSYGLDHSISESNSYLLITLVNVCGIPSRLLSGVLADMYGRFNVMIVMSILTTVVIFGVWLPAEGHLPILFTFAVLFGVSTSATISLIPACTSQICSAERFGKVYGTLYFFLAFLTIIGMYLTSVVLGNRTLVDYRNFVLYEGGYAVAAVVFWVAARYFSVGFRWCKF